MFEQSHGLIMYDIKEFNHYVQGCSVPGSYPCSLCLNREQEVASEVSTPTPLHFPFEVSFLWLQKFPLMITTVPKIGANH